MRAPEFSTLAFLLAFCFIDLPIFADDVGMRLVDEYL